MRVILLQDVKKVGKKGEIVTVADGYGQNFLIKNKLGVMATEAGKKELAREQEAKHQQELVKQEEARRLAKQLEDITLEFKVASGKEGKTFGSVSMKQVAAKMQNEYGIKLDKRKFKNSAPIATLGMTKLQIELYKGVIGVVNVHLSEK